MSQSEGSRKAIVHVHPDFYGVYLLQSVPKPRSFYIGSTPYPFKRLRQHNGDLKAGGAYRTKKNGSRPWRMIVLVYNFPSKIAALQFEHSFQHPYQTRHIPPYERISTNKQSGNTLNHKLGNVRLLLKSNFFKQMDLKLLIFDPTVYDTWLLNKLQIELPSSIDIKLTNFNRFFKQEINEADGDGDEYESADQITISHLEEADKAIFKLCKEKVLFSLKDCSICKKVIDYLPESITINSQNDLSQFLFEGNIPLLAICYHCHETYHLSCLATNFLKEQDTDSIIPLDGHCLNCKTLLIWSKLSKISTKLREYVLKDYLKIEYNL